MSDLNPIPEVPSLVEARVVRHPDSGAECLLATTEDGQRLAFAFEAEGDRPGILIVDPGPWLEGGEPLAAVEEMQADDWLQALVTHPAANEWLAGIKRAHPAQYHEWFAQEDYDDGGEQGSG